MIESRRANGQIASISERSEPYEKTLLRRLDERSKRAENGCIEWQGAKTHNGYGQIRVHHPRRRSMLVHRLVWAMAYGTEPTGFDVCHRCDNRACLNVEHLFLGSRLDNMRDMAAKGRGADSRGEKSGKAKLTDDDVKRIHELSAEGAKQAEIAHIYDIHPAHVSRLLSRKRWGHV